MTKKKDKKETIKNHTEKKYLNKTLLKTVLPIIIVAALFFVFTSAKVEEYQDSVPVTETREYQDVESFSDVEPYQVLVNKTVQEPYTYQEEYQEPYETTETYYEKEPYAEEECENVPLIHKKEWVTCDGGGWFSDAIAELKVTNLDDEGSTFAVWVGFNLPDGNKIGSSSAKYIQPDSSVIFSYSADVDITDCTYNMHVVGSKEVCETVTKYRDVPKTRTVTKYKTSYKNVTGYRNVTVEEFETRYRNVTKEKTLNRTEDVVVYKNVTKIRFKNRVFGYEQPFRWGY